MSEVERFRKEKDTFFAIDPQSPLTAEQKGGFRGLNYFPENPSLSFQSGVEKFPVQDSIEIQTTGGEPQTYFRYGRLKFNVDGQAAELTLYFDGSHFFLPFVDSQAGKETYGAGRYLEPVQIDDDTFLIDFNYAYNPYCAYNENWSCPLTPWENRLRVPIRAGEKVFHE